MFIMAQVLKNSRRDKIISSAKEEFLANGIPATSMRAIARRAGMAPGNIYRYFDSKEEIVSTILEPVFARLNSITYMLSEKGPHFSQAFMSAEVLASNPTPIVMSEEKLREILSFVADTIVDMQEQYRSETLLLVHSDEISDSLKEWLLGIIMQLLEASHSLLAKDKTEIEMICRMVSTSIFTGMREGIRYKYSSDMDKEGFRSVLRFFLLQSIMLLKY